MRPRLCCCCRSPAQGPHPPLKVELSPLPWADEMEWVQRVGLFEGNYWQGKEGRAFAGQEGPVEGPVEVEAHPTQAPNESIQLPW